MADEKDRQVFHIVSSHNLDDIYDQLVFGKPFGLFYIDLGHNDYQDYKHNRQKFLALFEQMRTKVPSLIRSFCSYLISSS